VFTRAPTLTPVQTHMNPVHTLPTYFFQIHANSILPASPRSSEWSLPVLSNQNFVHMFHVSHACYMARPSHALDLTTVTKCYEVPHYAVFFSLPKLSSLRGRNILLSTLFSNVLNLCSSLSLRDKVSHPYNEQVKLWFCVL
jgi:hypothetical protein